jgi:hypothetical protein
MKIIFVVLFGIIFGKQDLFNFLQANNMNKAMQAADDYTRRIEPQEHIIIPLIDKKEASYNPWVAPDIRKYRKKRMLPDKDIEFQVENS